ncbi:MAG TPA: HAD family hydrolase [Patescibacteria group bacterium]
MPTLPHYQALLFDIDKTLTNSQRVITQETRDVINRFVNRGYLLGFCTGKHYIKLVQEQLLDVLPANSIHVLTGGAQVVRNNGQILWQKTIPSETIKKIFNRSVEEKVSLMIKHDQGFWANEAALLNYPDGNNLRPYIRPFDTSMPTVSSCSLVIVEPTADFEAFLSTFNDITVTKMQHYETTLIDVTAKGVTKGTGLHHWSEITGVPLKEVIGFGDSANDLEFLQEVGFAVALGNAIDDIKDVADRVIGHTDDNGLATYLNEVLSTGEL